MRRRAARPPRWSADAIAIQPILTIAPPATVRPLVDAVEQTHAARRRGSGTPPAQQRAGERLPDRLPRVQADPHGEAVQVLGRDAAQRTARDAARRRAVRAVVPGCARE